jgi:hypothetical protein
MAEQQQILADNRRRGSPDFHAAWQPAEIMMRVSRKRLAAMMSHLAGAFPKPDDECLEIGFGSMGRLGDLITQGGREPACTASTSTRRRSAGRKKSCPWRISVTAKRPNSLG